MLDENENVKQREGKKYERKNNAKGNDCQIARKSAGCAKKSGKSGNCRPSQ